MTLAKRIYLNWDEAASLLGLDREGFRQLMLYKLSPRRGEDPSLWLRAYLTINGSGMMTSLRFGGAKGSIKANINWHNRESFYSSGADRGDCLELSNGKTLPLSTARHELPDGWGDDRWEATHGYDCGNSHCFVVWGSTWAIDPECVRFACESDGRFDALAVAPRAMCRDGFPHDLYFLYVSWREMLFVKKPDSIFSNVWFLRKEVEEMLARLDEPMARPEARDAELRSDARRTYELIIAALWAKAHRPGNARLSEITNTAANSLESLLKREVGNDIPSRDTISRRLRDSLKHGVKVGSSQEDI